VIICEIVVFQHSAASTGEDDRNTRWRLCERVRPAAFHSFHCQEDVSAEQSIFTARCTLVQSAVLLSYVVCPSVRLYVRND